MAELFRESSKRNDLANTSSITAWISKVIPNQASNNDSESIRKIHKVPPLLRSDGHNKQDYDPAVVSLGPYHYNKPELQLAEKSKEIALRMFVSNSHNDTEYLYNQVLGVIDFARSCYIEGSTDAYTDEEFVQMMLLDGCFILCFIECVSKNKISHMELILRHLGVLGASHLIGDMLLLENQLPYKVLQVLLSLKFNEDEWEGILHTFFKFTIFLDSSPSEQLKATAVNCEKWQPLHLLEIFRSYFLSGFWDSSIHQQWPFKLSSSKSMTKVKINIHSCRSVTELKAKGIYFRPSGKYLTDIKFKSYCFYGQLELPPIVVLLRTKATFLNLIAYEMCPSTPSDLGVTSYSHFMKSLIIHPGDVKELQSTRLLLNYIGSDEEVAKMFEEIRFPVMNESIFEEVKESIEEHYNSKAKTWIAELISTYFSSPWSITALLATTFLLILTFLQVEFTIYPRHNK